MGSRRVLGSPNTPYVDPVVAIVAAGSQAIPIVAQEVTIVAIAGSRGPPEPEGDIAETTFVVVPTSNRTKSSGVGVASNGLLLSMSRESSTFWTDI